MRKFLSVILLLATLILLNACAADFPAKPSDDVQDIAPGTTVSTVPATNPSAEDSTVPSTNPDTGNGLSVKRYATGTDFGGEIAVVGSDRDILGYTIVNIVIDQSGNELFTLPNNMIAAYRVKGQELSPSKNHIFATDPDYVAMARGEVLPCKYVLNKQGDIILSPEKNGYDRIICDIENFDQLADDGYLVVYKAESSYKGTAEYYWVIDFNGNAITKKYSNDNYSVHQITSRTTDWVYLGDGIIKVGDYLDLKHSGQLIDECPRDIDYIKTVTNWADDENGERLFKLESHASVYDFNNNIAGVAYNNRDSNQNYVGLINEKGELILEPFLIDFEPDGVCILEDKFLVYKPGQYNFYDLSGKLLCETTAPGRYIDEKIHFDSGFLKVGGYYVDYLNEDGSWLFGVSP